MTGKSALGYLSTNAFGHKSFDSLYVLLNRFKTFLLRAAMTFLMKKWNLYFDIYFDMWPNLRRWLKHCSAHSVLVPWMSEKIGRSGWNWHTGSFRRHLGLTWFLIWNLSTRYPNTKWGVSRRINSNLRYDIPFESSWPAEFRSASRFFDQRV